MRRITSLFVLMIAFPSAITAQTSLRGSRGSLVEQNEVANKEKLTRIENERAIARFVKAGFFVSIPNGRYGLRVDPRLERNRRYCRPWTVQFLKDLGTRFQNKFKKSLTINSCVRDIETQEDLRDRNGNAAATTGVRASSHLTGATADIKRLGLSRREQEFVRSRLLIHEKANHNLFIPKKRILLSSYYKQL